MTTAETFHYYTRREDQERACAARTTDPAIAAIHHVLADHYAELMRRMDGVEPAIVVTILPS